MPSVTWICRPAWTSRSSCRGIETKMAAIVGRKVGMTQIFDAAGNVVPVTVVQAGPCVVTNVRTAKRDGDVAGQGGFEALPERKGTKTMKGGVARAKNAPPRIGRGVVPAAGGAETPGQGI